MLSKIFNWFSNPPSTTPASVLLIRLMTGSVFFWEGIIKFVYTNKGVGLFTKIGIPAPEFMAHFVAVLEIVGGLLLIFGFLTRFIAVPFIIEMIVAILSTKLAIYLGNSPLPLPSSPPTVGFWALLHETRTDYAMFLTSLFLLLAGPGPFSIDALLMKSRQKSPKKTYLNQALVTLGDEGFSPGT
jgi:putative oxidoreductase